MDVRREHVRRRELPERFERNPGECVGSVGGNVVATTAGKGFCFQGCSDGSNCPDGESCVDALGFESKATKRVCVPLATDALAGTTWQSSTLALTAKSNGVQSSTYTVQLGPQTSYASGVAEGSVSATLVQVYDTSALHPYAGCTETTTYTGGTWNDVPPGTSRPGNLSIESTTSSTDRTGCSSSSADVTGEPNDYEITNGTAGYYFSGATMNLGGEYGAVPYADPVEWTFTKR